MRKYGLYVAAMVAIGGCEGNPLLVERTPAQVEVVPKLAMVDEGVAVDFEAIVRDESGDAFDAVPEGYTVEWTSSAPEIAAVGGTGEASALAPGEAEVTARLVGSEGASAEAGGAGEVARGSATIRVRPRATTLEYVSGGEQVGEPGTTLSDSLVVRVVDRHGTGLPGALVDFAVVDGGGTLSKSRVPTGPDGYAGVEWTLGPEAGENTAEARADGLDGSPIEFTAFGTNDAATVARVDVSPAADTLDALDETTRLSATAYDADDAEIAPVEFEWASLEPDVVQVNDMGVVTAIAVGTAQVVATAGGGAADTAEITVRQEVAAVSVSPPSAELDPESETVQLAAVVEDANENPVEGADVSWSSSDSAVVTVDGEGLVTAQANGSAEVRATSDGVEGKADITVSGFATDTTPPSSVASVSVTPETVDIEEGETAPLTATVRDADGQIVSDAVLEWWSRNPPVAIVNESGTSGEVIGRVEGTATIVVASDSDTATVDVTVTAPPPPDDDDDDDDNDNDGGDPPAGADFGDDFEGYAVGNRVNGGGSNGFSWKGAGGNVTVSSSHAYSGSKSLEFRYKVCDNCSAEQRFELDRGVGELWIEYWVRIPDNYAHRDDPDGPDNNKLFAIWAEKYSTDGNIQYIATWNRDGATSSKLRLHARPRDPGIIRLHESTVQNDPLWTGSMRGEWVRMRYHVWRASSNGAYDGGVEIWRDDKLVAYNRQWDTFFPGGNNYFRNGYLFGAANSGFNQVMRFYIDDFRVYTSDPGW